MFDDLRCRGHRAAEVRGLAQTDKPLICLDLHKESRFCRHRVIGVVYRLGKLVLERNGPNAADTHVYIIVEIFYRSPVGEKLGSTNGKVSYYTDAPILG